MEATIVIAGDNNNIVGGIVEHNNNWVDKP